MKKNILTMAALLIASAAFVACSNSDDNIIDQTQPVNPMGQYTMTIKASKGDDAVTRALDYNGNTKKLTPTWNTNDKVLVYQNSTKIGELTPTAATTTSDATLSGELSSFDKTKSLTFYFNRDSRPSYKTGQNGSLSKVATEFDWYEAVEVNASDITVENNTVSITNGISFNTPTQAIAKFTFKDKANDNTLISPRKLTFSINIAQANVNESFELIIPASTYTENGEGIIFFAIPDKLSELLGGNADVMRNIVPFNITAIDGDYSYTLSHTGFPFKNGKFYEITAKMTKGDPVFINGKFTINSNNDKVYFSRGNLQATYNGSQWSWDFAEHQWDFIGETAGNTTINGNGTLSVSGTVDLFGWVGASNTTWSGDLGTTGNAAMHGVSNYYNSSSYSNDYYGSNPYDALKADWGETIGTGWRTLTIGEWKYLFETRSTTSNVRYARANVNGKNGVILLPDDWSTDYHALTSANTGTVDYSTNTISSSDWTNDFKAHGAVFLPAAGRREGTSFDHAHAGSNGCYWSSTHDNGGASTAKCISFWSTGMTIDSWYLRDAGNSVRLVRAAE